MYYGYNKKELILADEAFIELLGYTTFKELATKDILERIILEKNKVSIQQNDQHINADFTEQTLYNDDGAFYLMELKNITVEYSNQVTSNKLNTNYHAIYLNVEKISDEIGLSVDDYKLYLDSFIDQSIIDENRLIEGNDKVIKNLSNLALTLKIPHINILLLKIQKLSKAERMPLIDQYYTKLALLTLEEPEENFDDLLEEDSTSIQESKEEVLNARFTDLLKNVAEETIEENPIPELTPTSLENNSVHNNTKVKEISLENVVALPISYSPQTAADELNLPVVLIEEFVDDFIEQTHQDKDHLLTSYYQKDMDNIHELGHKLKGAASNLRIIELADILEEIQFCTEHEKLEGLFITFWGHFLSLEDYMKQLQRS